MTAATATAVATRPQRPRPPRWPHPAANPVPRLGTRSPGPRAPSVDDRLRAAPSPGRSQPTSAKALPEPTAAAAGVAAVAAVVAAARRSADESQPTAKPAHRRVLPLRGATPRSDAAASQRRTDEPPRDREPQRPRRPQPPRPWQSWRDRGRPRPVRTSRSATRFAPRGPAAPALEQTTPTSTLRRPSAEPFILPGESLSKYRKDADGQPEASTPRLLARHSDPRRQAQQRNRATRRLGRRPSPPRRNPLPPQRL